MASYEKQNIQIEHDFISVGVDSVRRAEDPGLFLTV